MESASQLRVQRIQGQIAIVASNLHLMPCPDQHFNMGFEKTIHGQ
jgi:hypothetical protein